MSKHWFLNGVVEVLLAQADNADGLSIMRHTLPSNDAPPWHVHRDEDETFYILEGRVRFESAGNVFESGPGETIFIAKGMPHGYRVLSREGAKMLTVTRGGFEKMIRSLWRPATTPGLPPTSHPTPEMQARLAEVCSANGIDLLGPPII